MYSAAGSQTTAVVLSTSRTDAVSAVINLKVRQSSQGSAGQSNKSILVNWANWVQRSNCQNPLLFVRGRLSLTIHYLTYDMTLKSTTLARQITF